MVSCIRLVLVLLVSSLGCEFENGSIESCGLESVSLDPDSDLGTVLCNDTTKNQELNLASGDYFITLNCTLSSVVQVKGASKEGTTLTFTQNHMVTETSKLISFENLTLKGSNAYSAQTNPPAKFWLVNVDVRDFKDSPQSIIKTSQELYVVNCTFKNIQGNSLEGAAIAASNSSVVIRNTLFQDCSNQKESLVEVMLSKQLTLENTQVKNFTGKFAGALKVDKVDSVAIKDFSCLSCKSTEGNGGAIAYHASEESPKLEITNSEFTNCGVETGRGGGICIESGSSSVAMEMKLSKLTFSNVKSVLGAAIHIGELVNFGKNTAKLETITVKEAYSSAGGLIQDTHCKGTLEVNNLSIQDSMGYSCAIYGSYLSISDSGYYLKVTNSYFENCVSEFGGMFVDSLNNKVQVYFKGLKFSSAVNPMLLRKVNTTAKDLEFEKGSGTQLKLSNEAQANLEAVTFKKTESICIQSTGSSYFECRNCLFEENSNFAIKAEGESDFYLESNMFVNNAAEGESGLIMCYSGKNMSTVKDSVFANNYVKSYSVISSIISDITIENVTFNGNSGEYPGIYGSISGLYISNSTFRDQQGYTASFLKSIQSFFSIRGSSFINGSSQNSGGAIYASESTVSIEDSKFTGTSAKGKGGAIYAMLYSTLIVSNSVFENTYSPFEGGSILYDKTYLYFGNSRIYNSSNSALWGSYATGTHITNSVFEKCLGLYGGAIVIYESQFSKIEYSSFKNCFSSIIGGGVSLSSENYFYEGQYEVSNCLFTSNNSTDGGGVYSKNVGLKMLNSTFSFNKAESGAGLHLNSPDNKKGAFEVSGCLFDSNIASKQGGAVKWDDYKPKFINNVFINNTAIYGSSIASFGVALKNLSN